MIGLLFHFLDEFLFLMCDDPYFIVKVLEIKPINYRLTYSASELSGFTCTSSLTMNEKFWWPRAILKISSSLSVNEFR